MSDGVVQVAPDSTGKRVDTSELTTSAGVLVERQRVVTGDPNIAGSLANVTQDGELWMGGPPLIDLLQSVLVELRVHSQYLQQIANSADDPEVLRNEPSFHLTV